MPRRGFTLIELLVSMTIIAILVALTVPAVQQSREAARRSHCQNNLKQIALATIQFHDTRGCFPPGRIMSRPGDPPELTCGRDTPSWLVRILPYLEQGNFAEGWDMREVFANHPEEVRTKAIPTYLCPSRRSTDTAKIPTVTVQFSAPCGCLGLQTFFSGATGDYGGNHGDISPGASGFTTDFYWGGNGNGVIISSRPFCVAGRPRDWIDKIRYQDITDGASNTILAGEMHVNSKKINHPPEDGAIYSGWHFSFSTRIGGVHVPLAKDQNYDDPRLYSFGSWHPGVCQFAFTDGSVHALSTSIDEQVLGHLCVRNDGEVISGF